MMADELLERLGSLGERFEAALDLGSHDGRLGRQLPAAHCTFVDAGTAFARRAGGLVADADRLPFRDGSFDLIASAGELHAVNDLPGCLIQLRRALRPGGLLVAALVAGMTLLPLRRAFLEAEVERTGGVSARTMPMVDPAQAASLLQRAGFVSPVADIDQRTVRYRDLFALLRDLRDMGETNLLTDRAPLGRALLLAAAERFAAQADAEGRVAVPLDVLYLAGRAPR